MKHLDIFVFYDFKIEMRSNCFSLWASFLAFSVIASNVEKGSRS